MKGVGYHTHLPGFTLFSTFDTSSWDMYEIWDLPVSMTFFFGFKKLITFTASKTR